MISSQQLSEDLMEICVIENGLVPEALNDRYDSYPHMIKRWLSHALPEARFSFVSPVSGDPLPSPNEYDGYILTGSKHSVYEDLEWIHRLKYFVQEVGKIKKPILGICFGHQLMAEAFGGKVTKAEQGWGVGTQKYKYTSCHLNSGSVLVFHQDQVVDLPVSANVIGSSDHCPYGVLEYDFPAISVQYHPEFEDHYVTELAKLYGGSLIDMQDAQAALDSINTSPSNNQPIAEWAASFFRQHYPS